LTLASLPLGLPADAPSASLPSFKEVVRRVKPAVVNLSVVKSVKVGGRLGDPFMDQFFNRFFGGPGPGQGMGQGQGPGGEQWAKQRSLGSGVLVDAAAGYILTNNHVVEDADAITVKLYDKRELEATVVGRDPKTDLAVIKLKQPVADLPALGFGDSDAMEVGDWVLAIGSPFGLEQTVSHGIISAKGRVIGEGPYDDFLQTDAPINPGNSGGPLVDLQGEVVGINTAITSKSGGSEGIGFAIPSSLARSIYRQLVAHGKVVRGWLGISIQDLDPALAVHFGLAAGAKGVLVADVMDQGPARAAGLQSGDVIQAFNGKPVAEVRELQRLVADSGVDASASLTVWRDGKVKSLTVKVGNMDKFDADAAGAAHGPAQAPRLGLEVRALSPDEARQMKLDQAVVVDSVEDGSPAEAAGLQKGDAILEMGKERISSPQELARLAGRLKAGDTEVLRIHRGGRTLYLTLQLPSEEKGGAKGADGTEGR
jgi:serine protease Do